MSIGCFDRLAVVALAFMSLFRDWTGGLHIEGALRSHIRLSCAILEIRTRSRPSEAQIVVALKRPARLRQARAVIRQHHAHPLDPWLLFRSGIAAEVDERRPRNLAESRKPILSRLLQIQNFLRQL